MATQFNYQADTWLANAKPDYPYGVAERVTSGSRNDWPVVVLYLTGGGSNPGAVSASNPIPCNGNAGNPTVTPTVTAAAYAQNNCIGGVQTLTSAARVAAAPVTWASLLLTDKSNSKFSGTLLLFNANPSGSTFTDKTAAQLAAADISKIVAKFDIATSDWDSIPTSGTSVAVASYGLSNLGREFVAGASTSLYLVLLAGATAPTFASTSDLSITNGFYQD